MKQRKNRGIEHLKARYGRMFLTPWMIGTVMFFLMPLVQSIVYSFTEVTVTSKGVELSFAGLSNYREALISDVNYTSYLGEAMTTFLYSLPIILLLSIVLALLLNQRFRGRAFFRALYFMPVIIATGEVVNIIFKTTQSDLSEIGVSDSFAAGMFSVSDIVGWLKLDASIAEYITGTISRIFDLLWSCGIQIVLVLAGLQSIPASLYEASRVEGAAKWEEFWFITFPMLSRVTLLVGIFTMVELITDKNSSLISDIYGKMTSGIYDVTSAMLWFYFLVAGAVMGLIVFLYHRLLMRHWDS